ncbi:MAG: CBS domain-containing protein [Methanobrevibacter sp.]|jgi:CBS domain-containing protein|nr:CBS domain-containing protein [Candidatus Methanovirga meridionalis]
MSDSNDNKEREIMNLANKGIISIPQTTNIKDAVTTMVKEKFRRLPITDPGSGKLLGILTSMDVISFLGGGNKYNLMAEKHKDNFLSAINESVRKIMSTDVKHITTEYSVKDTLEYMVKEKAGAVPILNEEERIVGMVAERDFILAMAEVFTDEVIQDVMTAKLKLITTTPGTPIEGVSKIMVRNSLRRLPIVGKEKDIPKINDEKLVGILTSTDLLRFLGDSNLFNTLSSNSTLEILNSKVSDFMIPDVLTAEPLTKVRDLCEFFIANNIGGIPIVKDKELLGIITERDILEVIYNNS